MSTKSYDYGVIEWDCPHYRDTPQTETLTLAQPWLVAVRYVAYWVPAGWPFDGASIPRLFWRIVGPPLRATYRRGALLHDAAYKGLVRAYPFDPATDIPDIRHAMDEFPTLVPPVLAGRPLLPVEREEADDLIAIIAEWNGTAKWRARIIRRAVKMFGARAWKHEHAKYRTPQLEIAR